MTAADLPHQEAPTPNQGWSDALQPPRCNVTGLLAAPRLKWANCTPSGSDVSCTRQFGRPSPLMPELHDVCDLSTFRLGWAHACLRDTTVVFIGDSLTRYQYLNLVYFLRNGKWAPPAQHVPNRGILSMEGEFDFPGGWTEFYEASNARLGGHEICDCNRQGINWDVAVENRYYYDPLHNFRVVHLQWFGDNLSSGHSLKALNVSCQIERFKRRKGSQQVAEDVSSLCRQSHCTPGRCGPPFDWTATPPTGFLPLLEELGPDFVIFNVGHWEWWRDSDKLFSMRTFLKSARQRLPAARLFWKQTTPSVTFGDEVHEVQRKAGLIDILREAGVSVFPALDLTIGLANERFSSRAFSDELYFQGFVYVLLNKVLLGVICEAKGRD